MAISFVGNTGGSTSSADAPIDLTPLSLAQNDIVCVFGVRDDVAAALGVTTSGYTEPVDTTHAGSGDSIRVSFSYKRMGASPDSSVTVLGSGDAAQRASYLVNVFRGVDTATALDATTITATGDLTSPNAGSITTVTDGAFVVAAAGGFADPSVTAPSGYTSGNGITLDRSIRSAYKAIATAGAENPASWTGWTSAGAWIALTVALRPAASGTFGDGALAATGTATASFVGPNEVDGLWTVTATGTAAWVGQALAETGALSATGTGTVAFVGGQNDSGAGVMTGTVTVSWVGDKAYMTAVLEIIESRGAVSVEVS
jgi:hypothetical protein